MYFHKNFWPKHPTKLNNFFRIYTLNIDFDVDKMLHKGFLNMIKQSL